MSAEPTKALTARPNPEGGPAWAPNGRQIAFVGGHLERTRSKMSLYVADGQHVHRLAVCGSCGKFEGGRLGWSPDSKSIVFRKDAGRLVRQSLWVVGAAGGTPHRLTDCSRAPCAAVDPVWSPDGGLIAFSGISRGGSSHGLHTMHANGSQPTRIADGWNPQWSPDGRHIVFEGTGGIELAGADGSALRLLYRWTDGPGTGPRRPFLVTRRNPDRVLQNTWNAGALLGRGMDDQAGRFRRNAGLPLPLLRRHLGAADLVARRAHDRPLNRSGRLLLGGRRSELVARLPERLQSNPPAGGLLVSIDHSFTYEIRDLASFL